MVRRRIDEGEGLDGKSWWLGRGLWKSRKQLGCGSSDFCFDARRAEMKSYHIKSNRTNSRAVPSNNNFFCSNTTVNFFSSPSRGSVLDPSVRFARQIEMGRQACMESDSCDAVTDRLSRGRGLPQSTDAPSAYLSWSSRPSCGDETTTAAPTPSSAKYSL